LSEPWWRRKRDQDKRRYPWFDVFEEFDKLEDMMNEMMKNAFGEPSESLRTFRPYVYGFSMSVGPDGKPVIREFGNVQKNRYGPKIKEEREPLVDILEEDRHVVIVAELPGVEKEEINLNATENALTISVNTARRKYHKELILPAKVDPRSAQASYKNGVLEVRMTKIVEKMYKGERISVK
jgi:HSP20 family protein